MILNGAAEATRYPPDKVLAVAAKRRLLEESRHKLVVLDFVDILLS